VRAAAGASAADAVQRLPRAPQLGQWRRPAAQISRAVRAGVGRTV